ncbi:MAG: hypothetical protein RL038_861, partial [Actinomycetota bacterium]
RDVELRNELLERGKQLNWHPEHMRVRYLNWVEGLTGDWLISRQRFFGVPIPVWYPLDAEGNPIYAEPIVPNEADLPIDPQAEAPAGYVESQRNQPGGFMGDPDVMDTWATSSLTPQIAGGWERDADLWQRVFPFDLRPQAHEIIRTWLFATVVRAHLESDSLPFTDASISGWILDPDRKKMSKSKGNVVTPMGLLDEHGSDAVRYWAASGRPGTDTAFDVGQMKIGRRLAIKILNSSKFALSLGATLEKGEVTEALDQAMLADLAKVTEQATTAFHNFNYTKALEVTEQFFWRYCDDYLELVKDRVYGAEGEAAAASARLALGIATDTYLKLFAPFLPFVTDEVWSWWRSGSVHAETWPTATSLRVGEGDVAVIDAVSEILALLRKAKSDAKVSMKTEISLARISAPAEKLAAARRAERDLLAAGRVSSVEWLVSDEVSVEAELVLAD